MTEHHPPQNFRLYPEITLESTFNEVDQALYDFERPYYRYCASGAGSDPMCEHYPFWGHERARLTEIWHIKCPWKSWGEAPVGYRAKIKKMIKGIFA